MKHTILFMAMLLLLAGISMAIERNYALELNYYNGTITFRGISLLAGPAPKTENKGDFTLRVVSFYNTAFGELNFDVSENKDFILYIPYKKEGKEIVIFRDRERIFYYNIASFADVCNDGICQEHESYESCQKDCSSGMQDDFCDKVNDTRCDPDCLEGLDADCKPIPEEKEEPVIKPNEDAEYGEGLIAEEEKTPLVYYILVSLSIIITLISAITISGRHKIKKQNEQKLLDYVKNTLALGYAEEQIKNVLLSHGYNEREIDNLLKMV